MNNFYTRVDALASKIYKGDYDAILVEGYECVGKGRLIEALSEKLKMNVYRPTYDFIRTELPRQYRWIINWSYFDILRKTPGSLHKPIIFDRSMVSAAVYNCDRSLMKELATVSSGFKVLCVLVSAPVGDYEKFAEVRGTSPNRAEYLEFLNRFYNYLDHSGIESAEFLNTFDEEYAKKVSGTCASCDHYDVKFCTHPAVHTAMEPTTPVCEHSKDKGV